MSKLAKISFEHVGIKGVVSVIPTKRTSLQENFPDLKLTEIDKIISATGVDMRHQVDEKTCASDLCLQACENLLHGLNWEKSSVDILIFISQTPDYILPATACALHGRMGLSKHCIAFDVNLGCSGYVYGLYLVSQMLEAGIFKRGILLAGDTITKVSSKLDKSVYPLFGDAGTATALEYGAKEQHSYYVLGTDGSGAQDLVVPAGGFRLPKNTETEKLVADSNGNQRAKTHLKMDGAAVFSFTLKEVPALLRELLEFANVTYETVDAFVFHQANGFMLNHLRKKTKVPLEKMLISLGDYGNTSSASIPLAINHRLASVLEKTEQQLALVGFGVGFSYAAGMLRLSQGAYIPPVILQKLDERVCVTDE